MHISDSFLWEVIEDSVTTAWVSAEVRVQSTAYRRDASMGAKLLHALGFKNDGIGVLHGKLCRLTTQFAYLVNAKNLTTKQVCDLLETLPSAEGREYHYRASDNKRSLWKPSISDNPYKSTCSKDEKSRKEESASTSAVTSVTPALRILHALLGYVIFLHLRKYKGGVQ